MAYIDCENCYHGKVCQYRRIYHDSIVACEDWQPTADVVPKSEVEELIKSVDDMLDLACAMTGLELTYYGKYAELKKKHTEGEK